MHMIDMRCPKCNRPIKGEGEVVHRKTLPTVDQCPNCKTKLVLKKDDSDLIMGESYYFDTVAPINWDAQKL
jgi:NAD-dependent SIR2 family protein deacetylase